ncbi:phospho-sugar mutase [Exiguobacterium chiriqhucha]|uniref:phospho-sugar mutase n=1 Tax=Exiguobacterium chiriqhucha TaxID=1385984 RepID=UPI0004979748|nr:phospho-sugar mutase [Exiguobacterium chiriqhucha]
MNVNTLVEKWSQFPKLPADLKKELNELLKDEDAINDHFYKHLEFGTGGMRGEIGVGTNRLNIYTVRRAITGLAHYINEQGDRAKDRGVVIAYDCRYKSEEFAKEIVQVLGHYGVKSFLFDALRPTPELSFAVRYLDAFAGIVITASHNPPQYNGIKIYGDDGGQMPLQMAEQITRKIDEVQNELSLPVSEFNELLSQGLVEFIGETVDEAYLAEVKSIQLSKEKKSDLKIVFSPLHGTAHHLIPEGLKRAGYHHVTVVKEQMHPDPEFSTVVSPNPEDHDAFEYAIRYGEKYGADILLATDPDADRLGVAVRNHKGQYSVLTGNQTGALMLDYLLRKKSESNTLSSNGAVVKTIVTSEIGRAIAASYGIETFDTLTGFKFIGEKINEFEQTKSNEFLFGYEESYGYLIGDFVRDKDAVQAALFIAEVAEDYNRRGMTLYDGLHLIWERYGFYQEDLVSLTLKGQEGALKINDMIENVRHTPITSLGGLQVVMIEDYLTGIKTNLHTREDTVLDFPSSNVIKLLLENDAWVTLRPSGTEPKIKFYFGVKESSFEESRKRLTALKDEMMVRFTVTV